MRKISSRPIPLFESLQVRFFQEHKVPEDTKGLESVFTKPDLICAEQDVICSDGLAAYQATRHTTQNGSQELALNVLHFFLRFLHDVLADIVIEIVSWTG